VSSHFVFKKYEGSSGLNASSFNGNFFCAVDITEMGLDPSLAFGFTLEAKRFSDAVSLLKDKDAVNFLLDDYISSSPKITVKTTTGRIKFQSMNWEDAPDWKAFTFKSSISLDIELLKDSFGFCSNFCKNLPQNPSISIIECVDGTVKSTDGVVIAQVKCVDFDGISLKTHINNYPTLKHALSFAKTNSKVQVQESENGSVTFYSYTNDDGPLQNFCFGETKVLYSIPEEKTKWDDVCDGYLSVAKNDLLTALNFINCGSVVTNTSPVQFVSVSTNEGKLVLEMASNIDDEPCVGEVNLETDPVLENDAVQVMNLQKCLFSFKDLLNVIKNMKTDNVVAMVYASDKNVVLCFRSFTTGLKYQVTLGGFIKPAE
jgi:hypothetical protein